MTYNEAKKLAGQKPASNYLQIRLDYDKFLVLPYKDGLKVLEALETAELLKGAYEYCQKIVPLNRNNLSDETLVTKVMSAEEYLKFKMASLLNVEVSDLPRIESGVLSLEEAQTK